MIIGSTRPIARFATRPQKVSNHSTTDRYQLQDGFRRRIPDLSLTGSTHKLSGRLRNWWELEDFTIFRAEVKKAFKTDIPLLERSEWEDWFTKDKSEIGRLSGQLAAAERQIDLLVYRLFKLTPDEAALLDASVDKNTSPSLQE